jgi:plasmid stabilization system protein ParE
LTGYTPRAARQVADLRRHYEERGRPEATAALNAALEVAERRVAEHPEAGLSTPRPYLELARPGRAWIKVGRYWIACRMTSPPLIVAVFYDMANIPGHL